METPGNIDGRAFFISDELESELRELDAALRELRASNKLDARILRDDYQRRRFEAIYHSNKIEGSSLSLDETIRVVRDGEELPDQPWIHQQEARNLSVVLDYALELSADASIAITQNEIRRMHALLLQDIEVTAGRYRNTAVEIAGASFIPPPAFQLQQRMTALSDYIRQAATPRQCSRESPMLQAAIAHVALAQIHPFIDGNGRTARALLDLILLRRLYPACIIRAESRLRYIHALEEAGQSGDLSPFVELMRESLSKSWQSAA